MTARIGRARIGALVGTLVGSLLAASSVSAHAEVVKATPAQGAIVTGPVDQVVVTYSEALTPDSRLGILDPNGNRIAIGTPDPADNHRMVAPLDPPLQSGGPYTVRSTSISAEDGDLDRQEWTFGFPVEAPVPGTPERSPTAASASLEASPAGQPSPSASPPPATSSTSGADAIIPIVVALALVALGGVYLVTRGRRSGTRP